VSGWGRGINGKFFFFTNKCDPLRENQPFANIHNALEARKVTVEKNNKKRVT